MARNSPGSNSSRLRIAAIAAVLVFFLSVPLLFLVYGGLAAALSGVGFIALFALFQLPGFLLLRHRGLMPRTSFGLPDQLPVDVKAKPGIDADKTEAFDPS